MVLSELLEVGISGEPAWIGTHVQTHGNAHARGSQRSPQVLGTTHLDWGRECHSRAGPCPSFSSLSWEVTSQAKQAEDTLLDGTLILFCSLLAAVPNEHTLRGGSGGGASIT